MPSMEVLRLMSHLLITLSIIIGYVVLVYIKGEHDATLQGALLVAVGYWFGAVGLNKNNDK
jgi:hypothetical protein